ncbi:MAG: tRNA (adenosine(37)-N6)-threonylcarbamoyltransferase complex dimerization subunit type 1 TsaB [Desulfocapsaceae bacterium]|nr:tRNA (adenosine(37)-N6)-threonylcarbamoyltransferase complex dimerization subunit type 1 TsaB [Desulfocapsaceae bacterium]
MDELKPLILALDTSTSCCTLALTSGTIARGGVLASLSLNGNMAHSRRLLTAIDWLFAESAVDWSMIDGLAVGLGPGSFTGLRIGLATAKGLAVAAGKPLVGLPTLDALAGSCRTSRLICAALDARKREVYTAFYRCDATGVAKRISEIEAIDPRRLSELITEPVLIVGDGALVYGEQWQQDLGDRVEFAPMHLHYPSADIIGLLGGRLLKDRQTLDLAQAVPLYVRASDAELSLVARRTPVHGGEN